MTEVPVAMSSPLRQPSLGFGLGLRPQYYEAVLRERPAVQWFEILTENYLVPGGRPLRELARVREHYPVVMHGVSLSIGGSDPLDLHYLRSLRQLADRVQPAWISDHLCWTGVDGVNTHDLLPLPFCADVVAHVAARVRQVQDYLGQRIALENVSSYIRYERSEMSEWEFLRAVAEAADCLILLDINNVYVNSHNHGFDAQEYLRGVPAARVQQIHLAGYSDDGDWLIDTHDEATSDAVWRLYAQAIHRFGAVATSIERDDQFPPLAELLDELARARRIAQPIVAAAA